MKDRLPAELNVRVRTYDRNGNMLEERVQHNVFTNMGRTWLRNLLATASYGPNTYHESNRPKYVAVGTGGVFNGGSFRESVVIQSLELPVPITSTPNYWKELNPQPSLSDTDYFPTPYIMRYVTVIQPSEVSFGGPIEVSEVAMFTSACDPLTDPTPGPPGPATGMVAYTVFSPVTKTGGCLIEIAWELRT